jgi:hypothetical protein
MSIRSPLLTGLIHPINLLMLGVSVFAGLVSAWWLFPVGLVCWLVMVINVANDPSLRMSHRMHRREPLAQRFQKRFDRLERFQVSIFNSLASAPPDVRRALQPVQEETGRVVDEAYALCRRMTGLENYRLVTQSQADLEAELNELNDMIDSTDDLMTRQEYEDSCRALQGRIEKLEVVSTQLDRVEAQLISLSNELEGVITEVIRLQAMGAEEAERHVNPLVEKLREEAAQLETFERETVKV